MEADASKHWHDGFINTQVAAGWPRAERESRGREGVLVGWHSRREERGEQGELPVNERKKKNIGMHSWEEKT